MPSAYPEDAKALEVGIDDIRVTAEESREPVAEGTLAHAALAHDDENAVAVGIKLVIDDAGEIRAASEEGLCFQVIGFQWKAGDEGPGELGTLGLLRGEFVLIVPDDLEPEVGGGEEPLGKLVAARGAW